MIDETNVSWLILGLQTVLYTGLYLKTRPNANSQLSINNPNFTTFQRTFLPPYLLALAADWIQGPYLYHLYDLYGFMRYQVAVLYVVGHTASALLSIFAPFLANQFGRRNLCIVFIVFYSISCFMKISRNYGILLLERVFGGMAVSILFYTFEAWYIHEHLTTHDFPKEWIPETMKRLAVWNGWLSVLSGIVAFAVVKLLGLSQYSNPIGPFLLAIPCLLMAGIFMMAKWQENYGAAGERKTRSAYISALQEIGDSRQLFLIVSTQSMYESVIAVMSFLWTPVLTSHHAAFPLGVIFSCLMLSIIIGSAISELLLTRLGTATGLVISVTLPFLSTCILSVITGSDQHHTACFFVFLLYEMSVGLYFSVMRHVREKTIPQAHSASLANIGRIVGNIMTVILLLLIVFHEGTRLVFLACAALLCGTLILSSGLTPHLRQNHVEECFESDETPPTTA